MSRILTPDATRPEVVARAKSDTDYRTFLRCHTPGRWLEHVEEQFGEWLRVKKDGWEVPTREDGAWTHRHRRLQVRHDATDGARALRAEMFEPTELGVWRTRLLAVEEADGGWISLEVTNDRGKFVDVPNVAKWLIAALSLKDGDAEYSDRALRVGVGGVDEAIDVILDPRRRSPVFVAASDRAIPFDPWARQLDTWFRQTYGVGHPLILDPNATELFNERMLPGAGAKPWTVRTYLRGVDKDDGTSVSRHRFLGTERLGRMRERPLQLLLGRVAREQTGRPTRDDVVTTWDRRFARLADQELVAVDRPVVPAGGDAGPALSLDDVGRLLGLDASDRDSLLLLKMEADEAEHLRARLKEAGVRMEAATDRAASLEDELEFIEALVDELNDDMRALQDADVAKGDEIRRLQRGLAEVGRPGEAYDPTVGAEATRRFESYTDLLDGLAELEEAGVVFCGDPDATLDLQRVDTRGACLGRAWESCLVLADYVRAKREQDVEQGVDWFVQHTPPGYRTVPTTWHAHTETAVTRNSFGDERTFPVPGEVDPTGRRMMLAHFKLGRLARHSPRLHYLDDTARTGAVYIGYIGAHLTNTMT